MRLTFIASLVAFAATAAFATGQRRLIGFTANPAGPSSSITSQLQCDPPVLCGNALPPPIAEFAGDAAFSPFRRSVWHTDGILLRELAIRNCTPLCTIPATRILGAGSLASGLTINVGRREMYQAESIPGVAGVVTYTLGTSAATPCPWQIGECIVQLPSPVHLAGAITYDSRRDLIYLAASVFDVALPPDNVLLIWRRGDPACQPFCRVQVQDCLTAPLRAIRALAYDECTDTIYISDGRQTSEQRVIWVPTARCPTLRPVACCPLAHPAGELWTGFDLRTEEPAGIGTSCLDPVACPACPAMALQTIGTPTLGNGSFALQFTNAPAGGLGWIVLNGGTCTPGLPFRCGSLYPQIVPPPLVLGPMPLSGIGVCDGSAAVGLPIPNSLALCGRNLCAQGLVLCSAAGGTGLTNALQIEIGP